MCRWWWQWLLASTLCNRSPTRKATNARGTFGLVVFGVGRKILEQDQRARNWKSLSFPWVFDIQVSSCIDAYLIIISQIENLSAMLVSRNVAMQSVPSQQTLETLCGELDFICLFVCLFVWYTLRLGGETSGTQYSIFVNLNLGCVFSQVIYDDTWSLPSLPYLRLSRLASVGSLWRPVFDFPWTPTHNSISSLVASHHRSILHELRHVVPIPYLIVQISSFQTSIYASWLLHFRVCYILIFVPMSLQQFCGCDFWKHKMKSYNARFDCISKQNYKRKKRKCKRMKGQKSK